MASVDLSASWVGDGLGDGHIPLCFRPLCSRLDIVSVPQREKLEPKGKAEGPAGPTWGLVLLQPAQIHLHTGTGSEL